jgi:peptidoglycan L-alanyl-D-glutamate endopeptidase CwlK
MIDSRLISDLHPVVAAKATAFLAACKAQGIDVLITSTYRDASKQDALYAQGRTTPGDIVTKLRGGQSMHNFKCAFDFVPKKGSTLQWGDLALWKRCGAIAESVGLEWGGNWTSFVDRPHCQYTGGLTLADLRAGKKIV